MNSTHVTSKVNEFKGKMKEDVGHATGNESLAAEGVFDRVKGKVQEKLADAKDAIKHAVDSALEKKPANKSH